MSSFSSVLGRSDRSTIFDLYMISHLFEFSAYNSQVIWDGVFMAKHHG